jgi:outer membrane protein
LHPAGRFSAGRARSAFLALLLAHLAFAQPPRQTTFENSSRVHDLIRSGNLYLSLQDALALAIENNLDIELQRYQPAVTSTELLRTRGGGIVRGLNYTLLDVPAGTGGPLSPVLTNPAAGRSVNGSSVSTNALELGLLSGPQLNLAVTGTTPPSNGTAVPVYDPALTGQFNWTHQTTPQTNITTSGVSSLVTNITNANVGIQQGFASGAQVGLGFNNNHQTLNAMRSDYNLFTGSSLGLTVTQPLLRGFGLSLNRRFIRIAANEQKIGSLLFRHQLTLTVYGVIRLYTDFIALCEDERVKQEAAALAEKLFADTKAQVEEGTLAQVEMTRANAQVFSTRQDVINARGLREEQEAILKTVLTRRGNADPEVAAARIIPTDTLEIPDNDGTRPMPDLIGDALVNRADLGQARLQIDNSRIGLEGSRSLTKPQVDLLGTMQNNGLAGSLNPLLPGADPTYLAGYGGVLSQVFSRKYPTYGVGVQVTLPIHNRIAEADLARDEIQVKQSEVRVQQLQNQIRLEVEDALIAMRRARASYAAARQARQLQEESLAAEQAKFEVGASTSFFVIQYESLLAQARSTEVAARSSYVKARAGLQRAMGTILDENHISVDAALKAR